MSPKRNLTLLLVLIIALLPALPATAQPGDPPQGTLDAAGNRTGETIEVTSDRTPNTTQADPSVLCFTTQSGSTDPCARIDTLFTNVFIVRDEGSFPTDPSAYDVVYIGYGEGDLVDSYAADLQTYVQDGGGLIVSQPNLAGSIDVYPPGFEMTVTDITWPEYSSPPGPVEFTAAGASHPILTGLTPEDVSGNFDTVPLDTLGPGWSVLVKSVNHPNVALSVGTYGSGRLAFHSGNIGSASIDSGSDAYVRQLIEWAGAATAATGPDMQIDAIEVTQAIQDLNNSVEMIANKRTYVRVHVSSPATESDVFANLSGERSGVTLYPTLSPGNPGADITVRTSPDRGQINDSFWFELPAAWLDAGNLTLTATLDPANAKGDPNPANNSQSVTVTFLDTPPLRLRIFNVEYEKDGTTYLAANSHLTALESWLERAYPIDDLQVTRQTFTYPDPGVPDVDTLHGYLAFGKLLRILFSGEDGRTVYYGLVDDGGGFMRGKANGIPSTIAAGPTGSTTWGWDTDGSYGDWYGGHEIGHTQGRYHAEFCGAGGGTTYPYDSGRISPALSGDTAIYGFDIADRTLYDPNWKDVMTYCSNQWISDFTYEGIRDHLVNVGMASPVVPAATADAFLAMMGTASLRDMTGELQTLNLISGKNTLPLPASGDWEIVLLDTGDVELATYSFAPQELTDAEASPERPAIIAEIVPWDPDTARVEIRYQGQLIDARAVSANAPTVSITGPKGGEQFSDGPVPLNWNANDSDGDDMVFSVLFTNTGGERWETLATGLTDTSIELNAGDLPGGDVALRVVASDGLLSGMDTSGTVYIETKSPAVTLTSPADGATFYPAQLVTFQGSAYDPEDGQLSGSDLTWSSDVDGNLGTGTMTSTVNLSTGEHTITLRATDSGGQWTEVQHTITVVSGTEAEPNLLDVAPTSVGAVLKPDDTPAGRTLTLRNGGEGALNWTATKGSGAPWLQVSSTSGTSPSDLTLTLDPSGLAPGTYESHVTFISGVAANSPVTVPITMEVLDPYPWTIHLPLVIR